VLRWRRPLIRWIEREDPTYWREALAPLRADEMCSVIRLFERHLDGPRPWLLELGVGFQDHTELYDSISHAAICSDIYRDATAARIYTPRPNCLYGVIDVERLPFRPASFDLAFTSHVVEHFPDRLRDLRALRRILKPGALACHVVPMAGVFAAGQVLSTLLNVATLTPRIGRGVHGEFGSVLEEIRGTTRREWRRAFRESGFEVIDEASGTLGLRPLRPWMTGWIARNLGLHGSRVFLTRASVGDAPS
jgi:SAM-dependent methyltransferase